MFYEHLKNEKILNSYNMKQLPTAQELLQTKGIGGVQAKTISEWMIEFTKLHVEAALRSAAENAGVNWNGAGSDLDALVDKQSILNAYPLDNIK